jgi:hypothetical protein
MKNWKMLGTLLMLMAGSVLGFAQWSAPADDVPAYHAAPPAKGEKLPPILAGAQLTGPNFRYPWQVAVYKYAQKDGNVFYQLPCNCRCDRAMDHKSLRSCFEGLHGAECSTCAKEAVYAYQQTMKGKTVREIRDGIMHKDYMAIDLSTIHS